MTQNRQKLNSALPGDLRLDRDASPEKIIEAFNRLLDAQNRRNLKYDQMHAAHAGHHGDVKLNADLDLNGFRIKGLGRAVEPSDAMGKLQTQNYAGTISQVMEILASGDDTGLDLSEIDGGEDVVSKDTASEVRNIRFHWRNGKTAWALEFDKPNKHHAAIKRYNIVLFNGTDFLDVTDGTVASSEEDAIIETEDRSIKIHINKANLDEPFFTDGVDVKITPVSLIGGAYILGTPATHGSLVPPGDDFVNQNDAVNVVAVGTTAASGTNIIRNGDFTRKGAGATIVKKWFSWTGTGFPVSSGAGSATITTATTRLKWIKASHSLEHSDETYFWGESLISRLLPGELYYVTIWIKNSALTAGLSLRIYLKRDSDGADNLDNVADPLLAYAEFPLTDLTDSFQTYGGIIKVKDSPDFDDGGGGYADQVIVFEIAGSLGGSTNTYDKVQMGSGTVLMNFSPYQDEQETSDLLPSVASTPPDRGDPTQGGRGGWYKDPGEGGPITYYTA